MHGQRILVIDDNPDYVEMVSLILSDAGAIVDAALTGEEGLCRFQEHPPDLVLLDIMMPGTDGWQVCASLRELSDVPIMMLTVLDGADLVVRGLDSGADEFVNKSTSNKELLARARALLRRAELPAGGGRRLEYRDAHLEIDLERRQVSVQGQPVKLTPTEYRLLACLVRRADQVLTHQQILERVWGQVYMDSEEYLHVCLYRLRHKLEPDPDRPRYLLSQPGVGYFFHTAATGDAP